MPGNPLEPRMSMLERSVWLTTAVVATITAICLSSSGCILRAGSWGATYGSGPVTSEDRPLIGPVRSVIVGNAMRVQVMQAKNTSLRITAPADVLPRIETRLDGDTLSIDLLSGSYSGNIVVIITTPVIRDMHLSGACTAEVAGLAGDRCDIELSGASQATVRGAAGQAHVQVSGASRAELAGVSASRWQVDCSGASTCVLAGSAQDAGLEASGASTIDAHRLQAKHADAQADGASTIRLGRVGSLRQETSGASTITAEHP